MWNGEPDTYCGAGTELSEPERRYLLSVRGLVPIWLAEDQPRSHILFRCPLSPGHSGPHLTSVGEIDYRLAEFVYDAEKEVGYSLTSWYLVWGPDAADARSFVALTGCDLDARDADGREWSCCLPAQHAGSCRFNLRHMLEGEEDEWGLDLDFSFADEWYESGWRVDRNEELAEVYLTGEVSYGELAELKGLSISSVQKIVAAMTSQQQRSEAQKKWRAKRAERVEAKRVFIAAEEARLTAARENSR